MGKNKKQIDKVLKKTSACHKVWHKFSNWLTKTYGKDLWDKPVRKIVKVKNEKTGKTTKRVFKYRNFDNYKLSQRLVGYEVMCKIEKYVKNHCPEIKIVHCDDEHHAGSDLLLIPHPAHGITVIFVPQLTGIQNQFFLYGNHHKMLMKELKNMSYVYKGSM